MKEKHATPRPPKLLGDHYEHHTAVCTKINMTHLVSNRIRLLRRTAWNVYSISVSLQMVRHRVVCQQTAVHALQQRAGPTSVQNKHGTASWTNLLVVTKTMPLCYRVSSTTKSHVITAGCVGQVPALLRRTARIIGQLSTLLQLVWLGHQSVPGGRTTKYSIV